MQISTAAAASPIILILVPSSKHTTTNNLFISSLDTSSSLNYYSSSVSSRRNWNKSSKAFVVKNMAEAATATATAKTSSKWAQKTVTLPPHPRGCHLITPKIMKEIAKELSEFDCGLAHFFLQHTSASLTINENYDTDVRHDTETFLNRIVPEGPSAPWQHTLEGPDDMPAHIKSSMFGCSLSIPISKGRLNMGTWQGSMRKEAVNKKLVERNLYQTLLGTFTSKRKGRSNSIREYGYVSTETWLLQGRLS